VWKLIAGYSSLVGFVASLVLFFLLSLSSWITYTLDFVLFSTVCFLVSEILAKRDLDKAVRTQQSVGDQLMDQFTIRYNELALVKEIGEAASSILDPQLLLNFITDALQKRLQFNRGMIMLANPDKTKLVYTAGYGYNRREEELLKNTGFSLTNPNSQGIFYLVYRDMKPFLINDAAEIENRLSEKSANFMKELGIKAFICVPITYEGKPEGILAVDGTQLKNMLTQSDLSLLMGIAPQIGISLNNALAHKKLKESEERFRNLSDNSPDIIYQLNKYGTFTYTNPAWEDVLGHKISDILGKNFITFIREDDHEKFSKIFEDIIRSEATIRDQNFVMLNNHGQPRHMTFTGAPDLDAEENVIGIVGTLKDITKMRDMEAQLLQASKMEAIGTLTGGIAHDFNNIIQAIMGYNQLMMSERKGNQPGLFYLSNIEELTKRSVELVRQLLLFSRKVEPVSKIININDEINSMYNLLAKSIPRMIDIKTDLAEDIFAINADSGQIGQVIMNLIINARDAIEDSGQITIKTKNVFLQNNTPISNFNVPSGHYVELAVTDTGAGIAKDVIAHIFEPFFTTKEVGKGTGLGLSVVYGVVKSHQGFIYCESEPHQGATFTILFPAITEGKPQKQIETAPMRSSPEGTETILLVDDEKSILETSRDTLILYGYTILTAESGEQAIEIYRTEKDKINLVVLDLIMPGKGGKNCLMELMAINPQVKILMTSGYSSSQQIEDLYNAGATGFINKPYRSDDFLASIRKIIDAAH
ncbi:MAG TPA: PAS domain S-box protein, partial [Smithellaceae bacterium]|nr:PAS domain S-box protein [Smithellaceae bacterium]